MEKIKVIQIGVGGFGQSWLEILRDYQQIEIVAVVDIFKQNLETAKSLLNNQSISFYQDHKQALQEKNADAAIIITPPQTHKSLAIDALEAGLFVFMEKPITKEVDDAFELYEQSKKYSKFIMISQNYRWRPEIEALRKCVREGSIGTIEYGEWNFRRATKFGGWRDQYNEILIEDMSIHHFDLMRHILGKEAKSIYAKSMRPSWSWFGGNPVVSATIDFDGDTLINYFGSWVTRGKETSWNGELKLVGSKGMVELTDDIPKITLADGTIRELKLAELPYEDRAYSIFEMVQSIRQNRKPVTHIGDNLKSFAMIGGALNSIKEGKEISIKKIE
ncbi:Gfo/Idh/MocA family protein [Sediminibacillus massiliensis]|uniref:Gfo/Idh/MocA family protein n=1 Tax=Sediminibacillus massiliensis TaxID=1926277 RepID=UPI0009886D4B|nr:Gfo/Idh/MocA family oxidoreductase [Sediminibacillus massiliensis]